MKLRGRTKRVLPNIKQEDCKPVVIPGEASTFIATDTNTPNLTIKQEDTKEQKILLKQLGQSKEEHIYKCDVCDQRMTTFQSVVEHRESVHKIQKRIERMIKNSSIQPDIHDPNFYCKACERGYQSKSRYRCHLKRTHYMVLKKLSSHKVPPNDILPDPNDPNLYCRTCNRTYKYEKSYQNHCRYAHGMMLVNSATQNSSSGIMMDTYCQDCDKRLASAEAYRYHLFAVHQQIHSKTMQQNELLPNANDPNFYCRSCEKKLAAKDSFKKHLMLVHSIFPSAPCNNSKLEPDVNDPNHYCRACQKIYSSKDKYRYHLRIVHQMTLPRLIGSSRYADLPDPCKLDHYCSVCKRTYASLKRYRHHCRHVHFMVLRPTSIVNPRAAININDPDMYCAQCESFFSNRTSFKGHLRRIHSLHMDSHPQ